MDDLELIKSKINIVDLIQEYLPLKKAGVNYKTPCPFHNEKTPSFVVSPERGIWHCFGCGKGGDHFKFIMEKEGVDFSEALEVLAKRAGIKLKRKSSPEKDKRTKLFEANQKASQFYHHILTKHPLGKKALDYLHKRGITDQTIAEFQLGYAPNSWDSLSGFLKKRGYSNADLIEAGLVVESKNGGVYDRFRGRVMFPLIDIKDQIRGFAGRILDQGEPKYINSPQTLIFDKSQYLFGLYLSKSEIKTKKYAILTEGEIDMILSYQSGIKNVVASKGTALTTDQIELIKRFTDTILLCFDKDLAGDAASRRGIELADQAGLNIKVIKLEGGKDPAEIAIQDPKAWEEAVNSAQTIYDYYLQSAASRYNLKTADGKKRIAQELLPIWAKISDPLTVEHYIQKLAALLGVNEDLIRRELQKQSQAGAIQSSYQPLYVQKAQPVKQIVNKSRHEMLEEYLLSLLLKMPREFVFVPSFPETLFVAEEHRSLYVLLVLYLDSIAFKSADFSIEDFVKTLPPELVSLTDRLYLKEIDDKLADHKAWQKEIDFVVTDLKRILVKASLEKLSTQIKNAQAFGKIEQLETLNKRFRDLSLKLRSI